MLPPADERVLRENPKFAELYKMLTTVVLNPDGTTKNDPKEKERAAVEEVSASLHAFLYCPPQNLQD